MKALFRSFFRHRSDIFFKGKYLFLVLLIVITNISHEVKAQKPRHENVRSSVTLKYDFGAIGDGIADDTDAVHAFLSACMKAKCHAERGQYRVKRSPPKITEAISLSGDGIDVTTFIRDYDEASGRGFLHFEGAPSGHGGRVADLSIWSSDTSKGGQAIVGKSLPGKVFGNTTFDHIKISYIGTPGWDNAILFDGTENTNGAKGVRAVTFSNSLIFGANGYSLILKGVAGFSFVGGGFYGGGGHPLTGSILITGTPAVPSGGITITGDQIGYVNLSYLTGAKINASTGQGNAWIGGVQTAIDADETVDLVQIFAETFGDVNVNWKRSSIMKPDGTIFQRPAVVKKAVVDNSGMITLRPAMFSGRFIERFENLWNFIGDNKADGKQDGIIYRIDVSGRHRVRLELSGVGCVDEPTNQIMINNVGYPISIKAIEATIDNAFDIAIRSNQDVCYVGLKQLALEPEPAKH